MLMLQQMIVLFLLMMVGYCLCRKNILTDSGSRLLSWIVVNVANPALVLSGSVNAEKLIEGRELLMTAAIAVLMYVGLILISLLIPVVLRVPRDSTGVYKVMTIFSNIGFMGFPLISALYGNDALLYAAVFLFPFNILIYTYGIQAMTPKEEKKEKSGFDWKKVFNVGVICCVVSIIIAVFQIPTPVFVKSTISNLSNLTAPLSMMVIGASMANINMKKLFTDVRLLVFAGLKLLVIPVVGMLICGLFIDNEKLLGVCLVMLATPVASMSAMLAQQYGGDYELASKGVALTTVLSVITMPLVSLLLGI